ncbi:MAG: hypothetical protein ACI923_002527, partial [Flavobacteriales bacterium]
QLTDRLAQRLTRIFDGRDLPILNVLLKMAFFAVYRPLYVLLAFNKMKVNIPNQLLFND